MAVETDVSTPADVFGPDDRFSALCGGSDSFDCGYAVAEAHAGNHGPGGNGEAAIFERFTNTATGGQVGGGIDPGQEQPFTLDYDASSITVTWSVYGHDLTDVIDLAAPPGGSNPTDPAQTLVICIRQAEANDLVLNGMALPDLSTLASNTRGYLYIGGVDFTADFTLTGDVLLGAGDNAAAAVQFKITDLDPPTTVIPVPATLGLMLAGLGATAARRRAA